MHPYSVPVGVQIHVLSARTEAVPYAQLHAGRTGNMMAGHLAANSSVKKIHRFPMRRPSMRGVVICTGACVDMLAVAGFVLGPSLVGAA